MPDWTTISSLATAGGTLILAVATFSSTRSANRAARTAERALQTGLRPLLVPSRMEDPPEKVGFADGHWLRVEGAHAGLEVTDSAVYLSIALRNVGQGMAVLHGWFLPPHLMAGEPDHAPPDDFRRLTRDLFVPPGGLGFWQGALRDPEEPLFAVSRQAILDVQPVTVDLLYGDQDGGQRCISRFALTPASDGRRLAA